MKFKVIHLLALKGKGPASTKFSWPSHISTLTLLDLGSKLNTKTCQVDNLSTLGGIRLVFLQFLFKLLKKTDINCPFLTLFKNRPSGALKMFHPLKEYSLICPRIDKLSRNRRSETIVNYIEIHSFVINFKMCGLLFNLLPYGCN